MNFLQIWILGIFHPSRAFDELKNKPAPLWGLNAVIIRFGIGSLLGAILLLLIPNRIPFEQPYFTLISEKTYYIAQVFFLPLFGILIWLLMSSIAHVVLRLSGKTSQFDQILNVVGLGMLIPMLFVWIWDHTMILFNLYQIIIMSISHIIFQSWEIILESIGFIRILGTKPSIAISLSVLINVVFIFGGMLFIR